MASPTNHYKLGLFVLVGAVATVITAVLFGGIWFQKSTISYHSYFNESVQGLESGSPVKFRGVTIGRVSAIEIAPDHRMVDVVSELDTKEVMRMGLAEAGLEPESERFSVPTDLRAQLNSQGITGVRFISIDFFDSRSNPLPVLPFPAPPHHYIPAAPSMMKTLEDTITKAMERLPEMVDSVVMIMRRIDTLFATLEKQDISGKAVATLGHADVMMSTLQRTLVRIDKHDLGGQAATTLTELTVAVSKLREILNTLSDEKGLLASALRATDAFEEVARAGRGTQKDIERTLRDASDAADAIRSLVTSLERDPDMLLKGKAERKPER